MADDRILGPRQDPQGRIPVGGPTPFPSIVASAQSLYEAARNRAIHDCQMDRLFNPDFYAAQDEQSS